MFIYLSPKNTWKGDWPWKILSTRLIEEILQTISLIACKLNTSEKMVIENPTENLTPISG